jgi:hypothetical protein
LRAGCRAIDRNQARINVADPSVASLNPRKEKPVRYDREPLPARYGGNNVGSLSGFCEDLRVFGMIAAVNVADVVSPSG